MKDKRSGDLGVKPGPAAGKRIGQVAKNNDKYTLENSIIDRYNGFTE
jgi:hypothetical protein